MMKVRCIAVDDEPLALEILADYVHRIPFLQLIKTFDNALDTIGFLSEERIDLIFLDIQMEGLTGTQLLRVLKDPPMVIFTTAYDQYAVEGFELNATDYLMKPISFERFVKAVDRAYVKILGDKGGADNEVVISTPVGGSGSDRYIFLKTENRLQRIMLGEILFIEGQGDYLRVNTPQGRVMTLMGFAKMEELLPRDNFIRVHKSYIVAIDKIDSIIRNRIRIGEEIIPISDSYRKEFFKKVVKGNDK